MVSPWILSLLGLLLAVMLVRVIISFRAGPGRKSEELFGWPYELPPLNYFESPESPMLSFWYDPVVASDSGLQTTWGFSRDLPPSHATNLDEVYGPDNTLARYNVEDLL